MLMHGKPCLIPIFTFLTPVSMWEWTPVQNMWECEVLLAQGQVISLEDLHFCPTYWIVSNWFRKMSRLMTKPTKWHVRPTKAQISLGIRPVWWESSLCALWIAKDPRLLHADSKDSDQTGWKPRLIWVFAGPTCHFVGFIMRRLRYAHKPWKFDLLEHMKQVKSIYHCLTHISLVSHFWDIGKQCRPRSDAAECGVWSGSSLFANRNIYLK